MVRQKHEKKPQARPCTPVKWSAGIYWSPMWFESPVEEGSDIVLEAAEFHWSYSAADFCQWVNTLPDVLTKFWPLYVSSHDDDHGSTNYGAAADIKISETQMNNNIHGYFLLVISVQPEELGCIECRLTSARPETMPSCSLARSAPLLRSKKSLALNSTSCGKVNIR